MDKCYCKLQHEIFCNSISNICTELVHFSTIKHASNMLSLRIWYSTETHGTYWVFQNKLFYKIAYFFEQIKQNHSIWTIHIISYCYFQILPFIPLKAIMIHGTVNFCPILKNTSSNLLKESFKFIETQLMQRQEKLQMDMIIQTWTLMSLICTWCVLS